MTRMEHMAILTAFLTVGLAAPITFAGEPAPAEQKEKKDMTSSKADDSKKDEKKDMGGK